jgi:hypothetical protein
VALGVLVAAVTVWNALRARPPHETPTRREFDSLAIKVSHIEASLPNMERRILSAVEASADKVSAKVDSIATADYMGRQKLWDKVNAICEEARERLARLEAGGGGAKRA